MRDTSDDELRLLCARSLANLGLIEPARATAERIEAADIRPARDDLLQRLAGSSQIAEPELLDQVRKNLTGIDRLDLPNAIESWRALATTYWRAADGNVVRSTGSCDMTGLEWLGDLRSAATQFCHQHLADAARSPLGPVTIEGVSPPWIPLAIHDALPRLKDGYQPLIQLVQRNPAELIEAFALADLRPLLARAVIFCGEDALDRLSEHVRSRFGCQATGPIIPLSTQRQSFGDSVQARIRDLATDQKAEADRLLHQLITRDRARDHAFWKARFSEDRPKRVLIPTCRYSTYIQHASHDLADAFAQLGWQTRILIEPDDHSRLSTIAYHRAQLEFDPDLIVLINYPRPTRAEAFPTQTPFICWIQDSMPHLFDEHVGRMHGPRDFVFGHIYPMLFRQFGYPADRAESTPVVANARKFHTGPINPDAAARYACDIAYVSHHSETPEAMHARLCAEAGDPHLIAVLHQMRALMGQAYQTLQEKPNPPSIKDIPARAWAHAHAVAPDPRALQQLREQYMVPMFERVLRHEMLHWAADIAERRGWKFRIFGRGWESHPRLGQFAAGELSHGEDLRVAFQAAAVHLHASMTTLVHQRVMECALSGGLPICRIIGPNLNASRQSVLLRILREGGLIHPTRRENIHFRIEDHRPLQDLKQLYQSVGFDLPDLLTLHPGTAANMQQFGCAFDNAAPEQLLGDLREGTFRNAAGLENLIERAIQQPEWRRARSAAIADRVRKRFTHDVVAQRMTRLVTERLAATRAAA